jgi:HK97 gp10 family phage protein
MLELKTEGVPEAVKTLQTLSADLQEKGVRSALRVASKPVRDAMIRNAPDDPLTGGTRLGKAINILKAGKNTKIQSGRGKRELIAADGKVAMIIGPNKKVDGDSVKHIAWFTEWGTQPHKISAKDPYEGTFTIRGGFVRGTIDHPGARGQHWMSKSLAQSRGEIAREFYHGLEKWIKRQFK